MAAPNLADYTFQYTDTGPVMGGGLVFDVQKIEGLGLPDVRVIQQDRDGADGEFIFAGFTRARSIALSGYLKLPNFVTAPEVYIDQYLATFKPSKVAQPFYYKMPGTDQRVVFCVPAAAPLDIDEQFNTGYIPFLVQLLAEDPRKYSSAVASFGPVGLPTTSGGRVYPLVYPKAYGTISTGGDVTVINNGNKETFPILIINGAVSNPIVTNETANIVMQLSINLATGDQLVVDCGAKSVVLNGADRSDILSGNEFIELVAGSNAIRFTALSFSSSGTLQGTYRHAWQ